MEYSIGLAETAENSGKPTKKKEEDDDLEDIGHLDMAE